MSFDIFQFLRNIANVDEVYRKYLTTDETRYVEVVFVVDREMVTILYHESRKSCFE